MKPYHDLLTHILRDGREQVDQNGNATISVFGHQMRFENIATRFPVTTTNPLPFRWTAEEMFWYLSGDTNARYLQAKNVHIWDEWATRERTEKWGRSEGEMGPFTGYLFRSFGGNYPKKDGVDQIARLVRDLQQNPNSRRLLVTGHDPESAQQMDNPPCHTLLQFKVVGERRLSCQAFFRSFDAFNYAHALSSYALLTIMLAHATSLEADSLIITFGDVHVYRQDIAGVNEVLGRVPYEAPRLEILDPENELRDLNGLLKIRYEHLRLHGLKNHPQLINTETT